MPIIKASLNEADYLNLLKPSDGYAAWQAETDRLREKLKTDIFAFYKVHGPIAERVWKSACDSYSAECFGNGGIINEFNSLVDIIHLAVAHGATL